MTGLPWMASTTEAQYETVCEGKRAARHEEASSPLRVKSVPHAKATAVGCVHSARECGSDRVFRGAPEGIRTPNLLIRSGPGTVNLGVWHGVLSVNAVQIVRRIVSLAGV